MSKFENHLRNLLDNAAPQKRVDPFFNVKTASQSPSSDISVERLRKIATILRTTSVEPSYSELEDFASKVLS
jgi:hypothetical protein